METIIMKPDQFTGFMERVSGNIRPQSILNTIQHLNQSKTLLIQDVIIENKDLQNVEYSLHVDLDKKDILICYEHRGIHEIILTNIESLTVEVDAHTEGAINSYGVPCFNTTFKNWFTVTSTCKDYFDISTELREGLISKVKIL